MCEAEGRIDLQQPSVHMTDLTVYTEAGAAIFDGRDPYTIASPRGWHYLYPPLFAIIVAPLAKLDPQWQVVIWFAAMVLAGWVCYQEFRRLWLWVLQPSHDATLPVPLGMTASIPTSRFLIWLLWITSITMLLPMLNCLQRGQLGILLLYPLLLGLRLAVTSGTGWRMMTGGIVLALPVAIKLTPALPVFFVCCQLLVASRISQNHKADWRRARNVTCGVVAGLLLFLISIPSMFVGPTRNAEFLTSWIQRVVVNNELGSVNDFDAHSLRNQSLTNAVYLLGSSISQLLSGATDATPTDGTRKEPSPQSTYYSVSADLLLAIRALLVLLMFAAGLAASRHGDRLSMITAFALACMLTLLISPLSWVHHYVLWLPALWFAPVWLWQQKRQCLAIGLAISACAMVWMHYLVLPVAGRLGLLGLGSTLWFAIITLALLRMNSEAWRAVQWPSDCRTFPTQSSPSRGVC